MSELTVCMICLRSDRLLRAIETILFHFHDELCDYSLPPTNKAQYCSECIWHLRKFHMFKMKCIEANRTLQMCHKMNTPNMESFLKKQITPPSLSLSDVHRCKAFVFVHDDKNTDANITNTPKIMLKPNNDTNSTSYKIRVKKFTTCNNSNSQSSINMNKAVTLSNPTVNLSLNNVTNSSHTVSENTIDKTKQIDIVKNENVIKYVNNVTPLIKTADKKEVLGIENVDPLLGLDVLDNIKEDSDNDDDDDDTLCGNDDDNKDDIEFLDDDVADIVAQETDTTDFDKISTQSVHNVYTKDKSSVKNITSNVNQQIVSNSYTKGLQKIATETTKHTKIHPTYATDSSVPISNKSSVKNTASNVNNDVTSNVRNNAPPCKVSYTPYEINVTGTHSTNAIDNAVPEPSNEVSIYSEARRKWVSDKLRNSRQKRIVSQDNDKNKCLILMKQYDGPKDIPQVGKVNPRKLIHKSYVPLDRFQLLNSKPYKKLKENWPHINLNKVYLHLQNGKITLRHMKNGKIVKNLEKKNQGNVKKNVKKDVIKRPTLTKKAKRYLNLLSFINSDKSKTKPQGVQDKVADMQTKENSSNVNGVISQDSAMSDDNSLIKGKVTEAKIDNDLNSPLNLLNNAGNEKLTHSILCENQGLFKNISDISTKTLTELTNIKIQFDDQEYKILYDDKQETINTNTFEENINTNTMIDNLDVKIVDLAPDAVENEEIIECHENIHENSNKTVKFTNNTNSELKNEITTDSKEENNTAATENIKEADENNEEIQKETAESDDSDTERLSTKFAGKLMIRRLLYKFRKVLKMHNEIKTDNGDLLNKELLINFFNDMSIEDKFRVAQAMAETGQRHTKFPPEAAKILWKLQQKYENKYSGIFDIVYLNTEEKMLREFLERRTYNSYVTAKFKCDLCIQCFPSQHAYEYHKKWHDPSHGTYGCSLCQTWYKSKMRLYMHKQTHAVVYKCKLCTTVTHAKSVMINHWMNHMGQRVTCKICGEPYSQDTSYSDHLALHHSSHECNMCARNFASELGLSIHKRSKHPNSEEENFPEPTKCEVCDVTYSTQAVYLKHYRCKHDPNAPKMRTVRKSRIDANTSNQIVRKRKHNTVATPMSEKASELIMTNESEGRYASKTFAAATAAIKLARERNMMLQTGEAYQTVNETRVAASITQELTNFEEDIDAATVFKRETAPSYDTVVRALNEKRKTKNYQTTNDMMDKNGEENNEIIRDLPQHFNSIINSSRRNVEHEIEPSFDNIAANEVISTTVILRPLPRKKKTSTRNNAVIISNMKHTVDAATHTITVNKCKGLDMPQLFENLSDAKEHAITDGNLTGGKWKPNMPRVFDTMSSSIGNPAKSRHVSGKWRPNMHKVNNGDDALNSNDTRDIKEERNLNVGKRRPNVQRVFDTMSRNVAEGSMNVEGGKRKTCNSPEPLSTKPREINDTNITENENNMSHYDTDLITTKHNTASGRNVFAGKRRPKQVVKNYEVIHEDEASSNRNKSASGKSIFRGKRRLKLVKEKSLEEDVTQNYEIVFEDDAACSKSNASNGKSIYQGRRRLKLVKDKNLDEDITQNYEIVIEDDAACSKSNAASGKSIYQGKRRLKSLDEDVTQNYEIVNEDDAACSKSDAASGVFAGKRTQLDVRNKYVDQDVHYESRTVEAMTALNEDKSEFAEIIAGLSPSKQRKKVNVEMNPTYGYVYSTSVYE